LKTSSRQRGLRWGALVLLALLPAVPAHARVRHAEAWARERFANAERMREALNGRPLTERARRDYQRVINAYRNVYLGAPASTKADPSVVAVAEIMVEMGRRFEDGKILNGAIAQYKFLRREYPGSKFRFDALFTIGEIYKDDLDNPAAARATFEEFLHRYPRHHLAGDAQDALSDLDREAAVGKKPEKPDSDKKDKDKDKDGGSDATQASASASATPPAENEHQPRKVPRVTGIRHWSAPEYSRVAIDLEGDVKFDSQRIAHPDRIFFDLRGTKLASTLVGKSFDVDDGFLKKIRVAQFQPGRTRVVLEVGDLSDYDAFLIPNPYRLIIDIHGKNARGRLPKAPAESASTKSEEATGKAGSDTEVAAGSLKSELQAQAGKAPVARLDVTNPTVSDRAGADEDATKTSGKNASGKTKAPSTSEPELVGKQKDAPPVKKVVDADDEDAEQAAKSTRTRAATARERSEVDPAEAEAAQAKVSATRHTVVSRTRAKPGTSRRKSQGATDLEVREAQPTASGDRSLIRALGLKIGKIVIDPGHGGHDTGTIGPNGLEEKDLVLEVGKRLGKLLQTRLGAEVVYTRKDDTFIPLETRTAIANQERADLFVSIHANSSSDPEARGVETYYLNFTSSPEALEVAARENAVSEKSIYELQDLVKKIALKEKIEESREFASDVQQSLHSSLAAKSPAIRNRGVKKAPFIVLIGASMPSILAEISFVSNPSDERRLKTAEYRQRIAESLYRGIAKYVNGLSGVKVASKMEKPAGQ
jgi:N-acetylmuramoyl-L-alanine amidase